MLEGSTKNDGKTCETLAEICFGLYHRGGKREALHYKQ